MQERLEVGVVRDGGMMAVTSAAAVEPAQVCVLGSARGAMQCNIAQCRRRDCGIWLK